MSVNKSGVGIVKLKAFPLLKQPENSILCGAYCVAAALIALGHYPLRSSIAIRGYSNGDGDFTGEDVLFPPSLGLGDFIQRIYSLTGIIPKENPTVYDRGRPGLNSVVAMAYVFQCFRLRVEIVFKDREALNRLRADYPQEFRLNEKRGIPVAFLGEEDVLAEEEIILPSVKTSDSMNHCLAINPRGEVYDPARGVPGTVKLAMGSNWANALGQSGPWGEWLNVAIRVGGGIPDGTASRSHDPRP